MTSPRYALVVDDHPVNRVLASRLLGKSGWIVAQAEDGAQALAWLEHNEADLVLLDISMPNLSGQDVCRRVRAAGLGGPNIRLIAYTAHAMPEECEQFLACGFDSILVKPISRDSLTTALAALGLSAATEAAS